MQIRPFWSVLCTLGRHKAPHSTGKVNSMNDAPKLDAAVLIIGDEILSGRTQDVNLTAIARFLAPLGIDVAEARVVPDIQDEIVAAVNALRKRYCYVFTTGGIGPTHDDITADAIGAAEVFQEAPNAGLGAPVGALLPDVVRGDTLPA